MIAFLEGRHIRLSAGTTTRSTGKSQARAGGARGGESAQGHEPGTIMLMHEYVWTTEAQKTLLPEVYAAGWKFADPLDMLTGAVGAAEECVVFCGGVCEVCADAAVVLCAGRKESGQGGCG